MDYVEEFKKQYEEKIKKYNLPVFSKIDEDFFIQDVINDRKFLPQQILGFIRGRMVEAFGSWINFLHGFIMPNPQSAILMQDYGAFDEEDKKKIIDLIQDMMITQRESILLGLEKSEKKDAEFIKKHFKFWNDTKSKLITITNKSLENWKKREPEEVNQKLGL